MKRSRREARPIQRRHAVKRAVVLMPNGLTLFNLFCGIYAIILGTRGEFAIAPGFIVLGGIADTLDGRVARATGTGSRFGEELDSLVDAISFGFAPAFLMYLEIPNHGTWEWLLAFIFTACAVMRLARFNVEQAGRSKTNFHGLPSPAAGLTLASYYWFSQSPLYNQTVILFTDSKTLSDLPWHVILRGLMAILAALMISDVPYPIVPSLGFRSIRKAFATLVVVACTVLLVMRQVQFIFPALLIYVLYGAVKWVVLGFIGRSTTPDEIFWDEDSNGDSVPTEFAPSASERDAREEREEREARRNTVGRTRHETPLPAVGTSAPSSSPRGERSSEDVARRRRRRRGRSNRSGLGGSGSPPSGQNPPPAPPPSSTSPE